MRTMHFSSSIKTVGATVLGGLWALEKTNMRCVRSSGICMPNPKSLALIVSSAFIRTDRETDRRSWLDRLS